MSEQNGATQQTQGDMVPRAEFEKVHTNWQKEQARAVDYEKRYQGIDPEKVKAEREELASLKKAGAVGDQSKIDQLLSEKEKEVDGRYSQKLTQTEKERDQYKSKLHTIQVVKGAMDKIAPHLNPDAVELIEGVVAKSCDWQDDRIVILGEDGKPRRSKENPRELMTVDEFRHELAAKYGSCFKPKGVPGTKGAGEEKAATDVQLPDFSTMTQSEKVQYFEKNPEQRSRVLAGK